MRKAAGLAVLVLLLSALASGWEFYFEGRTSFLSLANWRNVLTWIGLFGILSLAQSLAIIAGGIDLSVGSVVGLVGIVAAMLMDRGAGLHPALALPFCLILSAGIGAGHGLIITRLRIQPFVVTLCGLFIYRGLARFLAQDRTQGFGIAYERLRLFGTGSLFDVFSHEDSAPGALTPALRIVDTLPIPFILMIGIAVVLGAYLHFTPQGRHLFALGANEEAARFSGVRTNRIKVTAYVLCSLITGLGGMVIAFKVNSIGPSDFGSFYELYAIAGAVLGGCNLRGGTGNVLGVVLGISLIIILRNLVNILGVPSELEYVVIGGAILVGVCVDEILNNQSNLRN